MLKVALKMQDRKQTDLIRLKANRSGSCGIRSWLIEWEVFLKIFVISHLIAAQYKILNRVVYDRRPWREQQVVFGQVWPQSVLSAVDVLSPRRPPPTANCTKMSSLTDLHCAASACFLCTAKTNLLHFRCNPRQVQVSFENHSAPTWRFCDFDAVIQVTAYLLPYRYSLTCRHQWVLFSKSSFEYGQTAKVFI